MTSRATTAMTTSPEAAGDESRILGGDGDDKIDGGPGTDAECVGAPNPDPAPDDEDQIRNCE